MTTLAALVGTRPLRRGDESEAVRVAQLDLIKSGAELTPDGKFGPITEAAVRRFQAAHNLSADGVVDSLTARHLDGVNQTEPAPQPSLPSAFGGAPWLSTMRAITGTREIPGGASNPLIIDWGRAIGDKFPDLRAYAKQLSNDAIAWCGHTVAYCMAVNDIRPPFVRGEDLRSYLWAAAWLEFGDKCPDETVGAVGVFTRNGGGHVTTIEGWTKTHFIVRGGNQSDMVNVTTIAREKHSGSRWPSGWPLVDVVGLTSNVAAAGSVR